MKHALHTYPMKHVAPDPYEPFIRYGLYAFTVIVTFFLSYGLFFAESTPVTAGSNVVVYGRHFEGLTRAEIVSLLRDEEAAAHVRVSVGEEMLDVPLSHTGWDIDEDAVADEVLAHSSFSWSRLFSSEERIEVVPAVALDEGAFASFAERVSALAGEGPRNATLVLAPSGDSYVVQEAHEGAGVPASVIRSALESGALTSSGGDLSFEAQVLSPEVSTQDAEVALVRAQELLARRVAVVTPRETVEANARQKAMWLSVLTLPGSGASGSSAQLQVRFAQVPVVQWVKKIVDGADRDPINTINHVDDQGNFLEVGRPGKPGIRVTNAQQVEDTILAGIQAGQDVEATLAYDEIPAGAEEKVKPAGVERLAYRPRGNEKWVDVNLTYSTLTAYEGTTPVYGPILINHGGVGHETVTGTYHVYLKFDKQDMGCTPDWPYCERGVPSVAYWHQSYALHAAPWVKEFGIGTDESSHGCINIPVDDALWLHGFTEIGTTVVTHYEDE